MREHLQPDAGFRRPLQRPVRLANIDAPAQVDIAAGTSCRATEQAYPPMEYRYRRDPPPRILLSRKAASWQSSRRTRCCGRARWDRASKHRGPCVAAQYRPRTRLGPAVISERSVSAQARRCSVIRQQYAVRFSVASAFFPSSNASGASAQNVLNRVDNGLVTCTPTVVARHELPDLLSTGIRPGRNQLGCCEQHTCRAKAALQSVACMERRLQCGEIAAVTCAFEGFNRAVCRPDREHKATSHHLSVQTNSACPAYPMLTTNASAFNLQFIPQEIDQVHPGLDGRRHTLSVDNQPDRLTFNHVQAPPASEPISPAIFRG